MTKTTKAVAMLGMVAALGVAALPLSTYAEAESVPRKVTVNVEVPEELSFTINTNEDDSTVVDLENEEGASTGLFTADAITLYVDTTAKSGYTISMIGSTDGGTDVAVLKNATGTNGKNEIAGTGFSALTGTASKWGYQASNDSDSTSDDGTYTAIPTTVSTIRTTTGAAAENTFVKFGAYVAPGQESGTYSGEVTFTAAPRN